jgi:shikimate O-hydroxycinnamoyltransferase
MEVKVLSSKLVKPAYNAGAGPAPAVSADEYTPLTIFDVVTYKMQMAIIYAFPPPAPSTAAIENGLAAVLAEYRAFAGQLGVAPDGTPAVLLNDRGARLVEAAVDADLVDMAPAKPTPELLRLHPDLEEEELQEVVLLQLTRFRCGSLAVGFTSNHVVADGHATSNFLVAWGRATRGLPTGLPPVPRQAGLFKPRPSPRVDFDHRSREWYLPAPAETEKQHGHGGEGAAAAAAESIVIQKAHFTKDFIARLRAKASEGRGRPFSRFETVLAHLWRAMTRARGLSPDETSQIRLSVDGRHRLGLPAEYFGNLVLWAFPTATVADLLGRPLKHAAQVIHDEVASVDGSYFRSFIDFATSGAAEREGLAPSAVCKDVLCPNVEVDSWLTFPFYELDFGTGSPTYFMPSYFPTEGMLFLVPSYIGDGSVDAFVPVFQQNLEAFKECCYAMD